MSTGHVVRVESEKGYGFIKDDETGKEYFFHRSALTNARFENLSKNTPVEFEPGYSDKGLRTDSVEVLR